MNGVPVDEAARLAAVRRYQIMDTSPEPALDRLARMTARALDAPMVSISIVDADRVWLKATVGLGICELPRQGALCSHTAHMLHPFEVSGTNALAPGLTAPPGVQYYAGSPLITQDGFGIGALCVMDSVPRPPMLPARRAALDDLAATVMTELERRWQQRLQQEASQRLALMVDVLGDASGAASFVAAIEAVVHRLCRHTGASYGHLWDLTRGGPVRLAGFAASEPLDADFRSMIFGAFDEYAMPSDLGFLFADGPTYIAADVSEASVAHIPLLHSSYQHGMRSFVAQHLCMEPRHYALVLKFDTPRTDLSEVAALLREAGHALRPALQRKQADDRLSLLNQVLARGGAADGFAAAVDALLHPLCAELDALFGLLLIQSAGGRSVRLSGISAPDQLAAEWAGPDPEVFPLELRGPGLGGLLAGGERIVLPRLSDADAAAAPLLAAGMRHGLRSLAAQPLAVGDARYWLLFGFAGERLDLQIAADLLAEAGMAIRPALLRKQAEDELALIAEVLRHAGGAVNFAAALEGTLEQLIAAVDALFGMVWTRSDNESDIRLAGLSHCDAIPEGFRAAVEAQFPFPAARSLLADLLNGEARMLVPHLSEALAQRYPLSQFGYRHGVRSFAAQSVAVGDTRYVMVLAFATERADLPRVADLMLRIGEAIRPVLQRKQAQDWLALLQTAIDATTDAVCITDAPLAPSADARILYTNPAFTRITGHAAGAVRGRGIGLLRGPDTAADAVQVLDDAAYKPRAVHVELLNYRQDGVPFWADVTSTPIADERGVVRNWVGVTRDTTERRNSQDALARLTQALQDRTRELTEIARMARIGSWRWLVAGQRFEWSDETFGIFGLPPGDGVPDVETFYTLLHPDDREAAYARADASLRTGQDLQVEARVPVPGSRHRIVTWTARALRDADGKISELRGYCQDVTEQREAAAALRHGEKLRTLGQLTGGIAHEFSNLLTVILANLEFAAGAPGLDDATRSELEAARRAASGATDLTRRLLTFARAEPLRSEATDLNAWLEPLHGMAQRLLGARYTITLRALRSLPPCPVDRSQLEGAVLNLLLNARDAMPGGGCIVLETAILPVPQGARGELTGLVAGDYAVVAVRDSGPGMPPDVAERAFEPFFTTKPPGSGSGLGLSTVLSFARRSGGTVLLDAPPGRGTAVRILLPLSPAVP